MDPMGRKQLLEAIVDLSVDLQAALEKALATGAIRNLDRLVLFLYFWRGCTLAEIAEILGVHEDVARRSLHKTLAALRDTGLLAGYGDPG